MIIMLIFKAVLFLGVARCASTSENKVIALATRSKRDSGKPVGSIIWSRQSNDSQGKQYAIPKGVFSATSGESLQAETTVHTIPSQYSIPGVTYNLRDNESINIPSGRGELLHRSTNSQPLLQGGFQASFVPSFDNRVAQNINENNPPSYASQASNQLQKKALIGSYENSQYYPNPSRYRLIPESTKTSGQPRARPLKVSTIDGFPPFPKFQSSPAIHSNNADRSSESPSKYRFNPGTFFNPNSSPPVGSPQRSNNPLHNAAPYNLPRNTNISPSAYLNEFPSASGIRSFDGPQQNYHRLQAVSSNENPAKKSPGSAAQTSPDITGIIQAFENEPVILSTGLDYQTHPSSSGYNFDYTKPRSSSLSNNPNSFSGNIAGYQPRVVPIQSSRSNPQVQRYKVTNVDGFSNNPYNAQVNGYQQIANQPQFHFTTAKPDRSIENPQPIVYHSKPFSNIRTDVELIDKKKRTTTPRPYDSEEDDFDPDFKTAGQDFNFSNGDDESNESRPSKAPVRDSSHELPSSNFFNSYDEAFGKYSKLASSEEDTTKKKIPQRIEEASKPVYQSVEEEDEESADDKSGEYRSSYTNDEKESNGSYEDEDEEESRRNERQGYHGDREGQNSEEEDEAASYRSFGDDFEREFEESYRKDIPKSDYVHVKEVPEVDEPRSESKKHSTGPSPGKTSRDESKTKSRHVLEEDYEKPKKYQTNSKINYRDNEGNGSRISYKRTKTAEPELRNSYGYKIPRDRGVTRLTKNKDETSGSKDRNSEKNTASFAPQSRDLAGI